MGLAAAVGRCYEGGGAPPFAPWLDLLSELRAQGVLEPGGLPPPFGDGPPVQTAFGLMQTVARRLAEAARTRPLVLLLDDLHWADPDTLELLWFVTRDLATAPLVVLAAYRPEDVSRGPPDRGPAALLRDRPVEFLRLTELSPADTARLIEVRYGHAAPRWPTTCTSAPRATPSSSSSCCAT